MAKFKKSSKVNTIPVKTVQSNAVTNSYGKKFNQNMKKQANNALVGSSRPRSNQRGK